jgi:imidazolonepropionase-like amidohydrolase
MSSSLTNPDKPLAIRGQTLIDGRGGAPLQNAAVVVQSGRIVSVGAESALQIPADATWIDAGSCTLMPGLIDAHLHLAAPNSGEYRETNLAHIIRSPAEMLLDAVRHAKIMLDSGFTTVRDLDWISPSGNFCAELVCLRESIAAGKIPGPRMIVGGFTHTTNSHFDRIIPRNLTRVSDVVGDGPWEIRKLARRNLRNGANVIKTCISGGSSTFDPYEQYFEIQLTMDELNALCEEAHNYNRMVSAHCHTPQSVRMALQAGVDTIEHCVFTDDEVPSLLAESGKYCIPTLLIRDRKITEARRARGIAEYLLQRREKLAAQCFDTFQRYCKAGVKIAMGTDNCVDPPFGQNAREIGIYVELGMKPMQALQTATRNAADAIGLGADLGTLEPGKIADIIAVNGDPLADVGILVGGTNIKLVMKDGVVAVDRRDQ